MHDRPGVIVYATHDRPLFVTGSAAITVGKQEESVQAAFEVALGTTGLDARGQLAYELFSASFFAPYAGAGA